MSNLKEKFASFGIATKGIVYLLIGSLTSIAAFGYGGQKSGSDTALKFIADQPFGKILLVLVSAGLFGYVFWRWYQAFGNSNTIENGVKGTIKRIAYFISGVFYGFFAITALQLVIGSSDSGNSFTKRIFESDYATLVAIIVGLCLIGKGVYEFYSVYSKNFKENLERSDIPTKAQSFILKSGKFGHTARGIVVLILGYLFLKAGFSGTANKLSKTDAFGFIENEFGTFALGIVALGLIGYAVFMLIKSKYSSLITD